MSLVPLALATAAFLAGLGVFVAAVMGLSQLLADEPEPARRS